MAPTQRTRQSLTPATRILAGTLAKAGIELDQAELNPQIAATISSYSADERFFAAVGHSFIWSHHASGDEDFLDHAVEYFRTGGEKPLRRAMKYAGRFGPDNLDSSLRGWRVILDRVPSIEDIDGIDAKKLHFLQTQMSDIAVGLTEKHVLKGVGAWLLFAPFKIIALYRKDLWQTPELDEVLMPLGIEVVRGFRKVITSDPQFAPGITANMVNDEEESDYKVEWPAPSLFIRRAYSSLKKPIPVCFTSIQDYGCLGVAMSCDSSPRNLPRISQRAPKHLQYG